MPTRNIVLTGHAEMAKLEALRQASRIGLADLDEDRFADVPADRLEDFIAGLGREAAERVGKAGVSKPVYLHCQGSMTTTPAPSKSFTLRVTTVMP